MYQAIGYTDVGRVRSINQDVFAQTYIEGLGRVAVVCDGMGGANAGEVASAKTQEIVLEQLSTVRPDTEKEKPLEALLRSALQEANRTVYRMAQDNTDMRGMGTTAVVAVVQEQTASIAYVGDSRAYRIGPETVSQLSHDHTIVQMLVDHGQLTPEQARNHPKRNLITRAVGADDTLEVDTLTVTLEPDEALLLCTDGLTGVVEDAALAEYVRRAPDRAAEELVALAVDQGSSDNITVLVVFPESKGEQTNG